MKLLQLIALCFAIAAGDVNNNEIDTCDLSKELIEEIASHKPVVEKIVEEVLNGKFKGTTYERLADFVDIFGSRISGSENLENAIDYMLDLSVKNNLEDVHGETVVVPHWVRGNESAAMVKPRYQNLPILGLGSSIGTPEEGIEASVVVVSSFDELDKLGVKVKGKIVVYNQEFVTYGTSVQYRSHGADRASKYEALATLVRSVTPFSLNSPHTGWQDYSGNVTKIPTACITVEDAVMLHRRYKRGEDVVVRLKMGAQNLPPVKSRNTVVNVRGSERPDDVVLISGHLDSWDVGEGAMDDGAGMMMSWNALVILKALGLRPRRTVRAVLWTGEEEGLVGAFAYAKQHKNESQHLSFVMESDIGTFKPQGLEFNGDDEGACILTEVMNLFTSLNATTLKRSTDVGSDIVVFQPDGIPAASLLNDNERYFWYHHSQADRLNIEDSDTLDKCTALWTAASYVIANLSVDIPRKKGY